MAQQTINVGAAPNDGTGTPLRTAFQYTNSNFSELYTAVGPSGNNIVVPGNATITGDLTVDTSTLKVDATNDRVGIGTTTPAYKLEVVAPAGDNIVSLFRSGDATAANNAGGGFRSISSATAASRVAQVWLDADGADLSGGDYFFIQKNGNSGTVEFNQSSNAAMTFLTNGTERARIDSSGNVGVGVVPTAQISSYKSFQFGIGGNLIGRSDNAGIELSSNSYRNTSGNYIYLNTDFAASYRQYSGQHEWFNAPSGTAANAVTFTQAMTLDASGNLLIGTTSLISGTPAGSINIAGANSQQIVIRNTGAAAGDFWRQAVDSGNTFYVLNNASTGVSITSGATSWSAVSDERLKDIIEPISNAIAKVGSLRSVIGKYKNDETNTRRSFLIAQDVLSVLPEAVDSSKSNELGLRYSELIPLLVAAIKELTARVEALEA